jgi:hypothetical protein
VLEKDGGVRIHDLGPKSLGEVFGHTIIELRAWTLALDSFAAPLIRDFS